MAPDKSNNLDSEQIQNNQKQSDDNNEQHYNPHITKFLIDKFGISEKGARELSDLRSEITPEKIGKKLDGETLDDKEKEEIQEWLTSQRENIIKISIEAKENLEKNLNSKSKEKFSAQKLKEKILTSVISAKDNIIKVSLETKDGVKTLFTDSIPVAGKFIADVIIDFPKIFLHPIKSAKYIYNKADGIVNT